MDPFKYISLKFLEEDPKLAILSDPEHILVIFWSPITAILLPWPTASDPITISFEEFAAEVSALFPIKVFPAPVVILSPDKYPIAVLFEAVFRYNDL